MLYFRAFDVNAELGPTYMVCSPAIITPMERVRRNSDLCIALGRFYGFFCSALSYVLSEHPSARLELLIIEHLVEKLFHDVDRIRDRFCDLEQSFAPRLLSAVHGFPEPIADLVGEFADLHSAPSWMGHQLGAYMEQRPRIIYLKAIWMEQYFRLSEAVAYDLPDSQFGLMTAVNWIRDCLRVGPVNGPRSKLILDALIAGVSGQLPICWDNKLIEQAIDVQEFDRTGMPLRTLSTERPRNWAQHHRAQPKSPENPQSGVIYTPYQKLRRARLQQVDYRNSRSYSPY